MLDMFLNSKDESYLTNIEKIMDIPVNNRFLYLYILLEMLSTMVRHEAQFR